MTEMAELAISKLIENDRLYCQTVRQVHTPSDHTWRARGASPGWDDEGGGAGPPMAAGR